MVRKIGLSARGHDTCVVDIDFSNRTIFAEAYERWTRVKHDSRFPTALLTEVLGDKEDVTLCVPTEYVTGKDLRHFDALVAWAPVSRAMKTMSWLQKMAYLVMKPTLLVEALRFFLNRNLRDGAKDVAGFIRACSAKLDRPGLEFALVDHHTSHAASAYYMAPEAFKDSSIVVTLDGQGDGSFCKVFRIQDNKLVVEASSPPSASIPLLFSIATAALGFTPSSDEGKLEALAAFGDSSLENPVYKLLEECFSISDDLEIAFTGSHEFPFSNIAVQWPAIQKHFEALIEAYTPATVAAGVQMFFEEFFFSYLRLIRSRFGEKKLCAAGGGFANVKLNRRIFEGHLFDAMFVFPAMGDDGAALGALVYEESKTGEDLDWLRTIEMPFFGSESSRGEVQRVLLANKREVAFEEIGTDYHEVLAKDLSHNLICAHFVGKMEFGPRALGNRSILANPMSENIRDDLNLKFKKREWFQPFCPSILEEEADALFTHYYLNRHMTCAFTMREQFWSKLPGIVHVDGTARAQFVNETNNPDLYKILKGFKKLTGAGVLINTSFNIHGKAIVRGPQDAIDDFLECEIDVLFIEGFRVTRRTY